MSLKVTQDDEQTGEEGAVKGRGNKGLPPAKEEMQEPSTAVIQMTIKPQSTACIELPASVADPIALALEELPQALLDIVPTEEARVEPTAGSCFEWVPEAEEPPMARYQAAGAGSGLPPRPAFSYRSDAALMLQYPAPAPAHSADAYDYIDEDEFALERVLAAIGQPGAVAGSVAGEGAVAGAGTSAGAVAGAVQPVASEGPALLEEPLDADGFYHELERGFDLATYEGVLLRSDQPSIDYSDNGAVFQADLFGLSQEGFIDQEMALAEELGMAVNVLSPMLAPPADLQLLPPVDLPLSPSTDQQLLPPVDLPLSPSTDQQLLPPVDLPLSPSTDQQLLPPADLPLSPSMDQQLSPPAEMLAPPEPQPGTSRMRAHAVQIYPGEGEGEPQTCYITNLPRLAIEESALQGSPSSPCPQQARPPARAADMLRQLLGAPADDEGEIPKSPAASEYSSEVNKGKKPDTIAAALRRLAMSFAADDIQTSENVPAESEQDNSDSPTAPEPNVSMAEEMESVAAPVIVAEMNQGSEVMDSDSSTNLISSTMVTEPTPIGSCQAENYVSVGQPDIEDPSQEIVSTVNEQAIDTAVATVDVDSEASNAPEVMGSGNEPVATAVVAVGPSKLKLNKPKRKRSAGQPAALKTGSLPLKAKTAQKAVEQGSSAALVPIESASESNFSSEDSNESKTLADIRAEEKAAKRSKSAADLGDDTADAPAAPSAPAASAIMPTQQSGSSVKAKGKRAASAQNAQKKQKQAKKVRTGDMPTTTMVLRSRRHLM